jgi:hypothetical protein
MTRGQDRFPGQVDLGACFGCMVSKCASGFCQCGAAGGSCKKLNAKFRFKPDEAPADD